MQELLSGQVPYGDKKSNHSVSRAIVAYQLPEMPNLDERYANYSSVLRRICRSCWEKDPQKRPTAEEIEDIFTSEADSSARFKCCRIRHGTTSKMHFRETEIADL